VKKVVHHLTRTTRILLIITTVLIALLITSTRLLLPLVEDYRNDLEAQISKQIGKPVTVGKLGAHLRGFYPELILKELAILSPDGQVTAARLKEIRVGFSLSHFLSSAAIRPLWVTLMGAELTITREKDGSLSIDGLGSGEKKREFPHWLFEDGRFEIVDSKILWQNLKRKGPVIELRNVQASLLNDENRHQLGIQAELPESEGRSITIKMDYQGNIAFSDQWQGTIYVAGDDIYPAKILGRELGRSFKVEKGRIDFEIWTEWRDNAIKFVQGMVSLNDSAVSWMVKDGESQERLALESLSGLFRLQLNESGWNFSATELVVTRKGESRQQRESITADYRGDLIHVAGSYLNLAELREALLETSLLTNEQVELLSGIRPSGQLSDFSVVAQVADNKIGKGWFCGRFNQLRLEAWRKVPGIENFEGRFCGTDQQGYVELGTGDAQVNLASLFRTPWQITNSQGRIYWQKHAQDWRLFSHRIAVETPEIKTTTQFELVFEEGQPPFIDLQSAFQEGVVANAGFYYPTKIMPSNVVSWLDQALVSGQVNSGGVLLRGKLNEFPFRGNEGVFEVLFDVEDARLDYQTGWPSLTGIGAEVRFYQDDLVITADRAILEGGRVEKAEVSIFGLRGAKWLNISGVMTGDVSQSMTFLKNSPLHNRVDALLNVMDVHGDNKIELTIDVPLRKGIGKARVDGTVKLKDAGLLVHGVDLEVSAVNGLLRFNEKGIEAKGLQATVLNEPVTVDLIRRKNDTLLRAKGRAAVSGLSRQFPLPVWPYLEGKAAYDLSLTIPMTGGRNLSTQLEVISDTKGIAINLPAPYGKRKNKKQPFSLSLPLKNGQKTKMDIRYADNIRSTLLFSAQGEKVFKLLKGEIRLDGKQPALPEIGLRLAGEVGKIEVSPWEKLQGGQPKNKANRESKDGLLQELDLKFGTLIWGGRSFNEVGFHLKRNRESWEGAISSQFGEGFMRLPVDLKGSSPLVLNLDNLTIPDWNVDVDGGTSQNEAFTPTQLPNLDIKAAHLIWKGNNLGALNLNTERMAKGVRIKALRIDSDNDHLQLNGEWLASESGENKTALRGNLKSSDMGNLVKRLSITEDVRLEDSKIDFSLNWEGSPWDMQIETLNGQFGLKLGKGLLVDIEPGIGRLLGLLSLHTVQRRLTLDFSDLVSEGLSFDKIEASYNVVSGDAWTNDFFLDSPVVRIDIQGRMGLARKDFDETVVVTPKTTGSLPVASALVAGPTVGAVVFVAQKLIGSRVEMVTRSRYSLTGSWDKPELVSLGKDKSWSKQIFDRVWEGLSGQEPTTESSVK